MTLSDIDSACGAVVITVQNSQHGQIIDVLLQVCDVSIVDR